MSEGDTGSGAPRESAASDPPALVVRGRPTPQQLAALVCALGALAATAPSAPEQPRDAWGDPARRIGAPPAPGPGAWWASARP